MISPLNFDFVTPATEELFDPKVVDTDMPRETSKCAEKKPPSEEKQPDDEEEGVGGEGEGERTRRAEEEVRDLGEGEAAAAVAASIIAKCAGS